MQYLLDAARERKAYEEYDEEAFAGWLADNTLPDLLAYVGDKQTYQVTPGKPAAAVNHDLVPALTKLGKIMKTMGEQELRVDELVQPFLNDLQYKHWSDSDAERDFVVVKFATPGRVEHQLDRREVASLFEAAKATPGVIEKVASALGEQGIEWTPFVDGTESHLLVLANIEAKWLATFDLTKLADAVAARLAVVTANVNATNVGWWDAARAEASIPTAILKLVRARLPRVIVTRESLPGVLRWAAKLPGGAASGSQHGPLTIRKMTADDILA